MSARLQLTSITIGSPDPLELARFYATLLNGEITHLVEPSGDDAGWAQVRVASDHGTVRLNFEHERQWRTPVWPSEPDRQHITQHLDIQVDDLDAAVIWAESCGAWLAATQPQHDVRVMSDPHGHPFCLFAAES